MARIGNGKIQGSLHYGGKSAAFGRDDVRLGSTWRVVGVELA
ncbi:MULTISPECIES: hypothetical protein [Acidobacteriaceae]|nr:MULTISPECIES: hypothetical protein [Acidobacteriaceae]MDW5265418.1 hypothetical protein [Edaphobacter sp.]